LVHILRGAEPSFEPKSYQAVVEALLDAGNEVKSYNAFLKAADHLRFSARENEPAIPENVTGGRDGAMAMSPAATRPNVQSGTGLSEIDTILAKLEENVRRLPEPLTEESFRKLLGVPNADREGSKPKRSTERAIGAAKRRKKREPTETSTDAMITNALCIHHKYDNGQCGNREPAKLEELRTILKSRVSKATLSRFIADKFCPMNNQTDSYKRYATVCRSDRIGLILKGLRGDLPLAEKLYGSTPPGERDQGDE
jgi:hypothetical protein